MVLFSIEAVYEIHGDNDEKKRKLAFGSVPSGEINGIFIRCKNFKFYKFNFKFANIKAGKNIVIPILHHARFVDKSMLLAENPKGVFSTYF